ncbi:hypothetical protein [Salinivibrio kushneri]|uniref:hypothetical protein n=1 Tax=Salinivibrio kushneri TaxID=1908198 RepID=UPI0009871603|nr:hypothetical protein [Salinivibrio kushneri]OOE61668.1 hypothetical protein BZG18_07635 [Salinivibrio kushneri]
MDNVLYFNAEKDRDGQRFDVLCAYLGGKAWQDSSSFYAALEKALKNSDTLPDCIIVYVASGEINNCLHYWENKELHDSFLGRLSKNNVCFTKALYFIELRDGRFKIYEGYTSSPNPFQLQTKDVTDFYSKGLHKLAERNNVLHIAPAGHTFKHPSGRISKMFIQSRDIAATETELQFVANGFRTLVKNVDWLKIKTVYIDTMGIYSIVKEAALTAGCSANIESYHSYDSLKELNLPSDDYLVVISASTSGGMARDLINRGFCKDKIVTLIDVKARSSLSHVLIDLSSTGLLQGVSNVDGNETDIELVGEHFSYRAKPPKQVTLGIPHKPKHLLDILKDFCITGINPINQRVDAIGKSPLLSLKPANLHASGKFIDWLNEELKWSLSSSIDTVVFSDDGASEVLAQKALDFIKNASGDDKAPSLFKWPNINKEDLKNSTGVIVVTAFAGDGGKLRQISRDLREYESKTIPRHFLIGVGLPQSKGSWKKLEQFLVRNATPRFYNFSVWKVLPLGPDNIKKSWDELAELAAKADNASTSPLEMITPDEAAKCYEALSNYIEQARDSLLPNANGDPLKLTEGFVFFDDNFDHKIDSITQSDTLLSMAAVLQTAREHADPEKCLRPTNYQSVIISPENFLRFNDDILQACILRASQPSELDYSSDHHLSELMKEFLYKVFTRHKHPFGYAALEFAGALAVGKLKLKKEHCRELVEKSVKSIGSESHVLTGFLLMAMPKS